MKTWESALVLAVTVGIMAMLATVLTQGQRISITRLPPKVVIAYDFDPDDPGKQLDPGQKIDPGAQAVTKWEFQSWALMNYDIESTEQGKDACLVTLKIKGVQLTLGLPVKIHLPKGASDEINMHEQGHVRICERVYEQAAHSVRRATEPIFNRAYTGSGKTIEEACANALRIASSEIAQEYQEETLKVVDDISEIYDFLQRKKATPPPQSVDQAFKIYNSGKPRRL